MRILFVSEEDRCRGPMARGVCEKLAHKHDLVDVVFDSAGIRATGGQQGHLEIVTFLKREKYDILRHRSKPLTIQLADNSDLILCMTTAIRNEARRILGDYYAPKVLLLNDAVDLDTKRPDMDLPNLDDMASVRRLYASMLASLGRLIRTLEEPDCRAEHFGAKTIAPQLKPGTGGAGPRVTEHTLDPQKRKFMANFVFDYIERSFEPPTTVTLLEGLHNIGQLVTTLELEEVLRQDLHGYVRRDTEQFWHVVTGAHQKRREKHRAEARARAEAEAPKPPPPPPPPPKANDADDKVTDANAYEILGIPAATNKSDAQKKFRALLHRYHPDKFQDDDEFRAMADVKTKRITEAWALVKEKFPDPENDPIV